MSSITLLQSFSLSFLLFLPLSSQPGHTSLWQASPGFTLLWLASPALTLLIVTPAATLPPSAQYLSHSVTLVHCQIALCLLMKNISVGIWPAADLVLLLVSQNSDPPASVPGILPCLFLILLALDPSPVRPRSLVLLRSGSVLQPGPGCPC